MRKPEGRPLLKPAAVSGLRFPKSWLTRIASLDCQPRAQSPGSSMARTSVSPSQPGQCFLCSSMERTALSIASCFDARRIYCFLPSIWERKRWPRSLISGVISAPKSSASNTARISTSDSPSGGFGQRFTHSTASSIERTCQIM